MFGTVEQMKTWTKFQFSLVLERACFSELFLAFFKLSRKKKKKKIIVNPVRFVSALSQICKISVGLLLKLKVMDVVAFCNTSTRT